MQLNDSLPIYNEITVVFFQAKIVNKLILKTNTFSILKVIKIY